MSDSVSVFAEGTFEDQLRELLDYSARASADDERAALVQALQESLKTADEHGRRTAFELVLTNTTALGQGTDLEIEGFFNLLYSHLFTLWPVNSSETSAHVRHLLDVVSSSPSGSASVKYRVLANLFNASPRTSALRLPIYTTLFQIASNNGELDVLSLTKSEVQRWLNEWDVSDQDKSEFITLIILTLTKLGKPDSAYEYQILLVHVLPASSPESRSAAVDAIAAALRLPTMFDFDTVYNLDPIVAVHDHDLFSLIQIFLRNGLSEFNAWVDGHATILETYQLDRTQLERKIRLLVFASLAFDYVGRDLPYATIASALQIDVAQVETWTIDVIRAGLVSGKLSQTTQQLHVYKSLARKFEREQWEALEKRLLAWKAGLASVIDIVAQAQNGGNVAEVVQTTTRDEQNVQVESTA